MARQAVAGAAVAAVDGRDDVLRELRQAVAAVLAVAAFPACATVLPEERGDALYHHYHGGGMDISGPSVLVRKNWRDKVSVSANYYVDSVTSASIDVMTTASPYTEQRNETRLGVDYLHDKTVMGVSWVSSEENDYSASTAGFSFSQDFFGDLTTLNFGYALGNDEVRRNGDPSFAEPVNRQTFNLGLAQVLSKRAVLGLAWDVTADQGYLHNAYRSVRFADPASTLGYGYQGEVYPHTRTSNAAALRVAYHLPWQDALRAEYRIYTDTWGVGAQNLELAYTRDISPNWRIDTRVRTYSQDRADFYSDLFPYRDAQNYLARDKELSTFDSLLFGFGTSYQLKAPEASRWKQMSFNLQLDLIQFDYADFRDVRVISAPGTEPQYGYDATITRLYWSLWY